MYDYSKSKVDNFLANKENQERIKLLKMFEYVTVEVSEDLDGGLRIEIYEGSHLFTEPLLSQREWDIWWSGRNSASDH